MVTRRKFLQLTGSGVIAVNSPGGIFESEPAKYPDYPKIPDHVLRAQGWSEAGKKAKEQFTREGGKWSTRIYQWDELREKVSESTGGTVDIPLGSLVAYRIGDTSSLIDESNEFSLPTLAKIRLREHIENDFKNHLHTFSKTGFSDVGDINWVLDPIFGLFTSTYFQNCEPSGTLTSEIGGSVKLHQFNLNYELNNQSANMFNNVEIDTVDLEFFGWLAKWDYKGHIYAVGGIHPNATDEYCGLDNTHLEKALSEAIGEEVNLDLDAKLYARMYRVMGSVR